MAGLSLTLESQKRMLAAAEARAVQAEAKAKALEEALGDELGRKEEDEERRKLREEHIERRRAELLAAGLPAPELASRLDQLASEAASLYNFDLEKAQKARQEQKEAEDAALKALQAQADRAEEAARRAERAYAQLILERAEKERLARAEAPARSRRAPPSKRGTDELGAAVSIADDTIDEDVVSVADSADTQRPKKKIVKKVVKKVVRSAEGAAERILEDVENKAEKALKVKTARPAEAAAADDRDAADTPADSLAAQTPFSVEAHVHDRMVHVTLGSGQGQAAKAPEGVHCVYSVVMVAPDLACTTGDTRNAAIWNTRDGSCFRVLRGHQDRVWAACGVGNFVRAPACPLNTRKLPHSIFTRSPHATAPLPLAACREADIPSHPAPGLPLSARPLLADRHGLLGQDCPHLGAHGPLQADPQGPPRQGAGARRAPGLAVSNSPFPLPVLNLFLFPRLLCLFSPRAANPLKGSLSPGCVTGFSASARAGVDGVRPRHHALRLRQLGPHPPRVGRGHGALRVRPPRPPREGTRSAPPPPPRSFVCFPRLPLSTAL